MEQCKESCKKKNSSKTSNNNFKKKGNVDVQIVVSSIPLGKSKALS